MSIPNLTFVDHVGGELAAIAASLATGRSIRAEARTTTAPATFGPEVAEVLREVGAPAPLAATAFEKSAEAGSIVELGGSSIANRRASLEVKRYDGPAETAFGPATLEKLALLRIARDRIDAYLDVP